MPDQEIDALRARWEADRSGSLTLELAGEYRRRGQSELAVEVLAADLEANPGHLAARVAKGRCHLELEQAEEARSELERVAIEDPAHLVANQLLADVYARLGDLARARDRLDLFELLGGDGAQVEALETALERARTPRPEAPVALRPEPSEASPPESPEPFELPPAPADGGAAWDGVESPSRALHAPSVAKAADPDPFVLLDWIEFDEARYAAALFAEGLFSPSGGGGATARGASGALAAGSSAAPSAGDPEPTMTLAELYRKQGHHEEAAGILRQILRHHPGKVEAARALGELEKQGSWPLSAEDLIGGGPAPSAGAADGSAADLLRRYRERLRRGK